MFNFRIHSVKFHKTMAFNAPNHYLSRAALCAAVQTEFVRTAKLCCSRVLQTQVSAFTIRCKYSDLPVANLGRTMLHAMGQHTIKCLEDCVTRRVLHKEEMDASLMRAARGCDCPTPELALAHTASSRLGEFGPQRDLIQRLNHSHLPRCKIGGPLDPVEMGIFRDVTKWN
jgi:hypothetical protein